MNTPAVIWRLRAMERVVWTPAYASKKARWLTAAAKQQSAPARAVRASANWLAALPRR
jgi:hypothetical protein